MRRTLADGGLTLLVILFSVVWIALSAVASTLVLPSLLTLWDRRH
ncbi:MAG: hypothetical protein WEB03_01715 [Nitriliruptor sp.]